MATIPLQSGWYDQDGTPWFKDDYELTDYVLDHADYQDLKPYLKDDVDSSILDAAKAYAEEHYGFKYEEGYF